MTVTITNCILFTFFIVDMLPVIQTLIFYGPLMLITCRYLTQAELFPYFKNCLKALLRVSRHSTRTFSFAMPILLFNSAII